MKSSNQENKQIKKKPTARTLLPRVNIVALAYDRRYNKLVHAESENSSIQTFFFSIEHRPEYIEKHEQMNEIVIYSVVLMGENNETYCSGSRSFR